MMMRRLTRSLAILIAFAACGAEASLVVVANAPTRVSLRVGSAGGVVDRVTFAVPAANVGNGTTVTGTVAASAGCGANQVLIDAEARAAPANSRTATLSVDTSTALTDGAGNSIPFNNIAWTSSGFAPTTIGSGTFAGAAGQTLATWQNSRRNRACLSFRYLNSQIFSAGTYDGRARFTVVMP